eukprot:931839-Rhodomonas_salina.1
MVAPAHVIDPEDSPYDEDEWTAVAENAYGAFIHISLQSGSVSLQLEPMVSCCCCRWCFCACLMSASGNRRRFLARISLHWHIQSR